MDEIGRDPLADAPVFLEWQKHLGRGTEVEHRLRETIWLDHFLSVDLDPDLRLRLRWRPEQDPLHKGEPQLGAIILLM